MSFKVATSFSFDRHDSGALDLAGLALLFTTFIFDSRVHMSHCNSSDSFDVDGNKTRHDMWRQYSIV